ncbi:MAG: ROK family protein [Clostridiales bacterium]|nr:ROK family protein [Clostridiales bacterium]
MYVIGIDIGGTTVKAGLIDGTKIISKLSAKTDTEHVMKVVAKVLKELMAENNVKASDIKGISLGCPGILRQGVVLLSANLKLSNCNLLDEMEKITSLPVIVKNDGDMAAIAEYGLGVGKGSTNMVMLTFGTGMGGGIILGGKLYEGQGGAGEVGHIPLVYGGKECGCGNKGCMERYVSCAALSDLAKEMLSEGRESILVKEDKIQASDIEKAYLAGDEVAKDIVEEYTNRLVYAFTAYSNIFRPDTIVVGGGLVHAPEIVNLAIEKAKAIGYGYKGAPPVDIKIASLGNDAGILAGAVLFD